MRRNTDPSPDPKDKGDRVKECRVVENQTGDQDETAEKARPLDPKTGAIILLGSLGISLFVMWILSTLFPFEPQTLERLPLPAADSQGAWIILVAWLFFPAVFAVFCLKLAKGVDPFRLSLAFAGVTYFLQCWAEIRARGDSGDLSLWPELLFTAVPTLIVHARASKKAALKEKQ